MLTLSAHFVSILLALAPVPVTVDRIEDDIAVIELASGKIVNVSTKCVIDATEGAQTGLKACE